MPPFSKREGYSSQAKEITIREDAPQEFRWRFLTSIREIARQHLGPYPEKDIRTAVASVLKKRFDPEVWHSEEIWKQVNEAVENCLWFRVYDAVEAMA